MGSDRVSRAQAAMLGLAIGDALGATTEFMQPDAIKALHGIHKDMTGGGWLELKPGQVTDDTEMTLLVAQSLVECKGFDAKHMADYLVTWYDSDPVDIGRTVRAGLHRYVRTGELERPGHEDQAGNGALMRVLPFALAGNLYEHAIEHAHLTHNNSVSDTYVENYILLVEMAMAGVGKTMLACRAILPDEYDNKSGGYVVETMNTVLYCFFTTTCFEDALVKCANLGGDADTTCAILGGLAGAYYGLSGIPQRWINTLDPMVMSEMIYLGDALTKI